MANNFPTTIPPQTVETRDKPWLQRRGFFILPAAGGIVHVEESAR